jgi:spermidine/putrescine transport system permease protein
MPMTVLCWKDMSRIKEYLLSLPSFLWLLFFFLIPTLVIFAFAFRPADLYGGVKEGLTLQSIFDLANSYYFILIFRTIWLSILTTAGCLALALPVGYFLARAPKQISRFLLFMIIVPFWSSFLIRIFAWKSFLHPEGLFKNLLVFLRLVSPETSLLYNSGAVLLVMIYTYLPFAIFPIYVAASKFNFQLFEAAMDLGASRLYTFYKIFIPCIRKGILSAMLLVFVPAIGAYVIPDLVGGTQSEMIGNKIAQRTLVDRNLPLASALAGLLTLTVVLPIGAVVWIRSRKVGSQE